MTYKATSGTTYDAVFDSKVYTRRRLMEFIACNTDNYRAGRTQPVRYIVMHYTANNGDT